MATEKTDVVIVGVGAAGGILAAELGKAGMKVIGLERGPRLTTQDFDPHDELRYFQRQDLRPNIKRQPITWRPNANAPATAIPVQNYGNQAGGGTVHYGAVSWRLHEDDFRARSHTIARYGASAIPEHSSLADWPLSYADLEPYYERAEYELGVSGKAGNLQGQKIDGGNVFEAPRRRDYPLPPLRLDQGAILFEAATRKLGYHPFSTPRAILSEPYHDRPACTYCGFCQAFGCHVGAKSSILITKLPGGDVSPREQRQQRSGDRRGLLRPGWLGEHDRGRARHPQHLHLRQHAAAAAVEDGQVRKRAREFERAGRQAPDGAHDAERLRHVRRPARQQLHGPERTEAHDRRLQRRQFRPRRHGLHPGLADLGRHRQSAGRADRPHHHGAAARHAALGRGLSRLPGEVLYAAGGDGRADRESPLRRPDDRPRPRREGCVGLARAAPDLRLATAERACARRVHDEEDGGDRAHHGSGAGVARAVGPRRPGRSPRGRNAHGKRSEDLRGQSLWAELGCPQPVHHRELHIPEHERVQPDAHHPGARLYERRRDREPLQEEPGIAAVAPAIGSGLKHECDSLHELDSHVPSGAFDPCATVLCLTSAGISDGTFWQFATSTDALNLFDGAYDDSPCPL